VGSETGNPFFDHGLPAGGTTGQVITKASGVDGDFDWADPAGGSGGAVELLAPVDLVFDTRMPDGGTYDNGTEGVGATLTATANGALVLDGVSATVGMRIVVACVLGPANEPPFGPSPGVYACGIYTVTDAGSDVTPWILTRATDYDTTEKVTTPAVALVTQGTVFAGAVVTSNNNPLGPFGGFDPGGVGVAGIRLDIAAPASTSSGGTIALGQGSSVAGFGTTTPSSFAAFAAGGGNWFSVAGAGSAIALGDGALAYNNGQLAHACNAINDGSFGGRPGISQHSWKTACARTVDTTEGQLDDGNGGMWVALDENSTTVWDKTILVRGTIVARRIDTPGTDSAWSFEGVFRGDGTGHYTWVGGSAPTATLIAQDAAAASWTVSFTNGGAVSAFSCLVTGSAGATIDWNAAFEINEVA
jgi:hypothetical protein